MYQNYKSLSKNPNVVSFLPPQLAPAVDMCYAVLAKKYPNWDGYIQDQLGYASIEDLYNALSAEQIDAIGLIIEQIKAKSGIILADETGVGKGRTLASIYKYCQKNKKKLLFFTYTKDLFSDFVRDLEDIGITQLDNLHVLHNDCVVYNPREEVVFKSNVKKNKKLIEDKDLQDFNLVMTTYSQVNSKSSKSKVEWLKAYCKDAVIVLDESHNAAGDSNTRKNIESLINEGLAVIYASATFLKNEDEFSLYKKAIDNLDEKNLQYLTVALEDENCEKLRSFFTAQMVKMGKLIRREHEPMKTKWEHLNVQVDEKIIDEVSQIFNDLFDIIENTKNYDSVYEQLKSSWFLAGNHINRVFKNIILLSKINPLIEYLEQDLKNNLKPVIVMESTFASIIKNIIDDSFDISDEEAQDSIEEKVYQISFKDYITWIFNKILMNNIPDFGLSTDIYEKIDNLKQRILNFDDSFASLSPIDLIRNKLTEKGYTSVEVSGRDFTCIEKNGTLEIKKNKKQSKTLLINEFNNSVDAAIITRSGSTGFSMHNSPYFKDNRTRVLYELEVSNRPTVRVQFIGRVRRKGQLTEPLFKTLVTNLPFEARLIEQQQDKLRVMNSHTSANSNRLIGENILNLYSAEADLLAKQFLINFPKLAFKMGINLNVKYEPLYFIDMLLKRCIVLPYAQCTKMYDYLLKGLAVKKTQDYLHNNSTIVATNAFINNMGQEEKQRFLELYNKNKYFAINDINYEWSTIATLTHKVMISETTEKDLITQFSNTTDIEPFHKEKLSKFFQYQRGSFYCSAEDKERYYYLQKNINLLKKGAYISFDSTFGPVFGYIHNIQAPEQEFLYPFPTHYGLTIKTLNANKSPEGSFLENFIYIDLNTLALCNNLNIRNNEKVDFTKFTNNSQNIEQHFYAILGNPIFVSYLQKIYQLGYIDYLTINDKSVLSLIVSKDIPKDILFNLRKPLLSVKEVINYILYQKLPLYTSASEKVADTISIVPSTGGINIHVAAGYNNRTIFDIPMNKVLGTYQFKNGQKNYFVNYKDAAKVLAMLKKRGVNFFK